MVEAMDEQRIRETFKIKVSPYFGFFKDDTFYQYEGHRTLDAIKAFIEKDYEYSKNVSIPIPKIINWFGLQYLYIDRYVQKKQPIWNQDLDNLAFKDLGYAHFDLKIKLALTVGFLSSITSVILGLFICLCCFRGGNKKASKGKSTTRSRS